MQPADTATPPARACAPQEGVLDGKLHNEAYGGAPEEGDKANELA